MRLATGCMLPQKRQANPNSAICKIHPIFYLYLMKYLYPLLIILLFARLSNAQSTNNIDTTQKRIFTSIEKLPEFPAGMQGFSLYLSKNLKYPDVARLIGIIRKLRLSFVVDKDGSITDVTPKNCIGACYKAEAFKLLENSPKWSPGIQDSKPVRIAYSVPINFTADQGKVTMKNLRNLIILKST
jgi:protein TonB